MIGFGGPTRSEEVRPFLQSVLQGVRVPPERFETVLKHYDALGGRSPYNSMAYAQRDALAKWFKEKGADLPVYAGFRHSSPGFKDVFLELKKNGIEKVIGLVLSPLRSYASFGKYMEKVEEAQKEADALSISLDTTDPFYNNSHFLAAQAGQVEAVLRRVGPDGPERTVFIFSAHSIPSKMSDESGYAAQFSEAASAVARGLGLKHWECAYQSRSGDPREPWLGPDVKEAVQKIDRKLFKDVVVVPIGFVSDNAEVLYDLDIELKGIVTGLGLEYFRASTVMDHPRFIEMMGEQILLSLRGVTK